MRNYYNEISMCRSGIMGLSIVSIILFHQYFCKNFIANLFHNYGYWGVDVFLFLSGMGLVRSIESHSLQEYYKRRLLRIIPPCLFLGTFKYILVLLLGASLSILKADLNIGWWSIFSLDLWFVNTILLFYLLSPFLYKFLLSKNMKTITLVIVIFILNGVFLKERYELNWHSPVGLFSWSVERFLVFTFGMVFYIRREKIKESVLLYSFVFLFIAVILVAVRKYMLGPFLGHNVLIYFCLAFGVIALTVLIIHILKILPVFIQRTIAFLGNLSLELYLIHEFIFGLFLIKLNVNPYMQFSLGVLLSVLLAYLCKLSVKVIMNSIRCKM